MNRIGVFICHCGTNIAATVDVAKVVETIKKEQGVVYAVEYQYMCSENGQQLIRNAIKEYGLTGIVIGSCSPRMHEATFRKAAQSAGLNPYMVEVANIREQCSWIHKDIEEATKKKKMDFSRVKFLTYDEGLCVQCMHNGSYDDEPATVELMHNYMEENGYELDITDIRYHHEIYLSDPRKCDVSKLKTVIRHPIKKVK